MFTIYYSYICKDLERAFLCSSAARLWFRNFTLGIDLSYLFVKRVLAVLISLTFWLNHVFHLECVVHVILVCWFQPDRLVEISRVLKPHLIKNVG